MFGNINGGIVMKKLFLIICILIFSTSAQAVECYSAYECTVFGELYIREKDYKDAVECFDKAISFYDKCFIAYAFRAKANFYLKEYHKTFNDASKSIEILPNPVGYGLIASAKLALGDEKGAIEDTTKALELDSRYMKCYEVRARAKVKLKDYNGALEDIQKALALRPNYAKSYEVKARAEQGLKDYRSAKRDFEVAEGFFKLQEDTVNEKKMQRLVRYCKRRIR